MGFRRGHRVPPDTGPGTVGTLRDPPASNETRSAVLLGTLAAGLMLGQTVFAKATRDALFLSNFPVEALPKLLLGAAVLSLFAMLASSRAMAVYTPARVVPAAFLASAALYVAEWALSRRFPAVAAVAVYLHLAILSAIVSSGFWSLVNERFDPHTARKVFGRIAGGGTVGAVIGGLGAWQFGSRLPLSAMLAALATLNLVCAWFVRRLARPTAAAAPPVHPEAAGPSPSGLAVLREVPYLRQLGLLVGLVALVQSQLDYILKDAASTLGQGGQLVAFFALFHAGAGLLSFLLQSTLSRPALDRLGLAGTVALLPGFVVLAGFVRLVVPSLWSSVALAGVEAVLSTSLYRAGYELMYTPLAKARKRPTKTIIDVGIDRLGTTVGAGATMLALLVASHGDPTRVVVGIAIAAALAALFAGIRLHEGYVEALAESLRTGAVHLDSDELFDAASRRTLAETHVELSRKKLLEEVSRLRDTLAGRSGELSASVVVSESSPPVDDPLAADILDLRSPAPMRIARVLGRQGPLPPELISHVVPLLGRPDTARAAASALRRSLPRATGQLLDTLLDPEAPAAVRRRLPGVLSSVPSARVVDGLMRALEDGLFEVRYRSALALLRATEGNAALTPPRDLVLAAARREVDATLANAGRTSSPSPDPDEEVDSSLVDASLRSRVDRRLECVFTILCLALDREPLRIAFRALATEDEGLRGTALEYLDNVLPESLRDRMRPLLGDRRPAHRPTRPRVELVDELIKSTDSISLNLESLKKPRPPKQPES